MPKKEADAYVIRHKASGATEHVGPVRLAELEPKSFDIVEELHNEKPAAEAAGVEPASA